MNKILFVDTETTGLNPTKNAIHQIAGQIVVDGKLMEEFDLKFAPHPDAEIEKEALKVSGLTTEQVQSRDLSAYDAYCVLDNFLTTYVDKYDKNDKFVLAGWNVGFDAQFLNSFYNSFGNKYFFGLAHGGAYLDGLSLALMVELKKGKRLFKNRKLATVCSALGVRLDNAHDALADIRATRNAIRILWKKVVGGKQ